MSTHTADRCYPRLLHEEFVCRNGQAPDGRHIRAIKEGINHCCAYRRRLWAEKVLYTVPNGAAGSTVALHVGGHTGENAEKLVAIMVLAAANGGTDPYVEMGHYPGYSGGAATYSNELHYGRIESSPSDVPDEMLFGGILKLDVSPDTDYRVWFRMNNYARIKAFSLFEQAAMPLDTTVAGVVDPSYGVGSPIYDAQLQDDLEACSDLWKHNAGPVCQFISDCDARSPTWDGAVDGVAYGNIFAKGTSTVSASPWTPGYRVNLGYHNTLGETTVPVTLAVYAERTAGAGAVADNCVRVTDGTNTITVSDIGTQGWHTATGTLPASDNLKLDFHCKTNATDTIRIDAVHVYEYEA